MKPNIFVALTRLAANTLPNARLSAIPNPRKKKETTTTGYGGVQASIVYPAIMKNCARIIVFALPNRPRNISTTKAAETNPMALVTKINDTTA